MAPMGMPPGAMVQPQKSQQLQRQQILLASIDEPDFNVVTRLWKHGLPVGLCKCLGFLSSLPGGSKANKCNGQLCQMLACQPNSAVDSTSYHQA